MGQQSADIDNIKENKKELKKHAATIHCSNTLSLLQRKITNALLYHAYQELMLKSEHEITVKQLCRLIGYQGNNHAVIKEALRGLISTIIEWNLIDDETGSENWTASSIIASVSLKGPICYYAYSPRMKELLHSPSMFGKIDLVIQSQFRSSYGLALYENCIRYRDLPYTKWFDMELFKKLMGVPPEKYVIFRDFKRRVLDKSVDEVNTYSNLIIIPELIKEKRKVTKIRFKLKERAKKSRLGHVKVGFSHRQLEEKLQFKFQLSKEQIKQLLEEYEASFIEEKMFSIEASRVFQEKKVHNLAGYLLSALKHNYQYPSSQQNLVHIQDVKFEMELTHIKQQVEQIRTAYQAYREKAIHDAINAMAEAERESLMKQFYQHAESAIFNVLQLQRNKYTRENVLEAPQIQAILRQFALRELNFLTIFSLEEFVMQQGNEQVCAWQKLKSYDPDHLLLRFSE